MSRYNRNTKNKQCLISEYYPPEVIQKDEPLSSRGTTHLSKTRSTVEWQGAKHFSNRSLATTAGLESALSR